jgi:hypothetical protein
MDDTSAETLTKKLKRDFGDVPKWDIKMTQACLDAGDPLWNIRRMYCSTADDYNKFRQLARAVHRRCKKNIGKIPHITEDRIKRWIVVDGLTESQIMVDYQREFNKAYPEVRQARKLLAEMRRDLGVCNMISESNVLNSLQRNLGDKQIKENYAWHIAQGKKVTRAEALRYRLEDEVSDTLSALSNCELLKRIGEGLTDVEIVGYYQERTPKTPEVSVALTANSLPAGEKD